jgi:hypothetical protein
MPHAVLRACLGGHAVNFFLAMPAAAMRHTMLRVAFSSVGGQPASWHRLLQNWLVFCRGPTSPRMTFVYVRARAFRFPTYRARAGGTERRWPLPWSSQADQKLEARMAHSGLYEFRYRSPPSHAQHNTRTVFLTFLCEKRELVAEGLSNKG